MDFHSFRCSPTPTVFDKGWLYGVACYVDSAHDEEMAGLLLMVSALLCELTTTAIDTYQNDICFLLKML
jgi:hypothetical protein